MTPFEEGRAAAARGQRFDTCPYAFVNCGSPPQAEFEQKFRPLMDEWFEGWNAELAARGLGFTR